MVALFRYPPQSYLLFPIWIYPYPAIHPSPYLLSPPPGSIPIQLPTSILSCHPYLLPPYLLPSGSTLSRYPAQSYLLSPIWIYSHPATHLNPYLLPPPTLLHLDLPLSRYPSLSLPAIPSPGSIPIQLPTLIPV
jgi:hypothetical protein